MQTVAESYKSPSTGPIRSSKLGDDREKKGPIAAPVKSACTFCRSRKSRCDGNKPCAACVARSKTDDCIYTVSRRGGKPKPKMDQSPEFQSHMNRLLNLTDMPFAYRRVGGLDGYNNPLPQEAGPDYLGMHSYFLPNPPPPPQSASQSFQTENGYPQTQPQPMMASHNPNLDQMGSPQSALQQFDSTDYSIFQQPSASLQQQQQQQQHIQPPISPQNHVSQMPQHSSPAAQFNHQSLSQFPGLVQQHQPQTQRNLSRASESQPQPPKSQPALPLQQQQQHELMNQTIFPSQSESAAQTYPSSVVGGGPTWPPPQESNNVAPYLDNSISTSSNASVAVSSRPTSYDNSADGVKYQNATAPSPETTTSSTDTQHSNVKAILFDYYRYLYRFVPVLPPPRCLDIVASTMTLQTPFILAVLCVLPLLKIEEPPLNALHKPSGQGINFGPEQKKQMLKSQTLAYERKVTEGIDSLLESAELDQHGEKTLEIIQALCVMVVFEYGSGRAIKSRLKADQALGLAMGQGYHKLRRAYAASHHTKNAPSSFASVPQITPSLASRGVNADDVFEMKKRCWWTVWSLVLWAAYNTGRIPTLRADDPRVKCEMPKANNPDCWTSNIGSLQALLLVQDRVLALAQYGHAEGGPPYVPRQRDYSFSPKSISSPDYPGASPFSFGTLGPARSESDASEDVPATFHSLPTNASRQDILDSMLEIDAYLQDQITSLETRGIWLIQPRLPPSRGNLDYIGEEHEESLRIAAAVQLYTSSLTLHIGQAFQGASLFERKLCFLNSINDNAQSCEPENAYQQSLPNTAYDDQVAGTSHTQPLYGLSAGMDHANVSGDAHMLTSSPSWNSPNSQTNQLQPVLQDVYTRGPFSPRLSLQRCVHASKRLLDIAKIPHGQSINPNPFNCCSFVLISFVLLMQALAVHGGFGDEGGADDGNEANANSNGNFETPSPSNVGNQFSDSFNPSHSQQMLFDRVGKHERQDLSLDGTDYDWQQSPYMGLDFLDSARQAQLRGIWTRVREARDTLVALGKHWEAVRPMADEVNLCLETSQLLLGS